MEAHDEAEIESAAAAGARLIGVNNRNLKDFTVIFPMPRGCGAGYRRRLCS